MTRRERALGVLRENAPVIAPSMLKCDFARLADEVDLLDAAGAKALHWDVMDGHFVPNLSYGAMVIADLRERTDAVFDAHLMVSAPGRYLDEYLKAGCDLVTVHVEADDFSPELLDRIRDAGVAAGVCLNPETPVERLAEIEGRFDLCLVMSVNPGFGGQSYLPGSNEKIAATAAQAPDAIVGVDGGVAGDTIAAASAAGASYFVCGSSVFGREDYASAVQDLAKTAAGATR
ncbi:ribulose-phosphate 3-epimerase [Alienimonas californiensis]|uniref:Ribulose-phosphate 3-epimerase n=1 Tax=Alienimonas californiensis TaxID=2527989 RepID=A0A517PDR0_9PLAN|nr:ribulose-phosphate 3-epimerase [Alienimonas californiensis]QDT17510.1 Ribulose-phosphate 3-epimerase [Alienimonas californiensis]